MKQTKRDPTLCIKKSTLYAILSDIEALHERVHEVAYANFERPIAAMGLGPRSGWTAGDPECRVQWGRRPDYPPSPPMPEHVNPWYAATGPIGLHDIPGGMPDLPPRYSTTHRPSYLQGGYGALDYSYAYPARPPSSFSSSSSRLATYSPDRRPRSPTAKVPFRHPHRKGGPPSGPHGTPNVTRTAPKRIGNRDRRANKKEKRKRNGNKKGKQAAEESSEEEESERDEEEGSATEDENEDMQGDGGYDPRYPALGSPRMQVRS
jgi:hypothetical protein